jgi:hypothetical protein
MACRVVCDLKAEAAAALASTAAQHLPPDGDVPAYEIWRRRIANEFTRTEDGAGRRILSGVAPRLVRASGVMKEQLI